MRHDIRAVGAGFALRPLTLADAPFVVRLRGDPERARHIHATSSRVEDQMAWTERYFDRWGDWYFVVENRRTNRPEGLVAVYDVEADLSTGEFGRWVLEKNSLAALESAALALDTAFDVIGLQRAVSRTRAANEAVVSFFTSLGSTRLGLAEDVSGDLLVEQVMSAATWRARRGEVHRLAHAAADLDARRAATTSGQVACASTCSR